MTESSFIVSSSITEKKVSYDVDLLEMVAKESENIGQMHPVSGPFAIFVVISLCNSIT